MITELNELELKFIQFRFDERNCSKDSLYITWERIKINIRNKFWEQIPEKFYIVGIFMV